MPPILHAGDPAVFHDQPPVVGAIHVDAHIAGAVFVLPDQIRVLKIQVGVQHIRPAEQILHLHGRGNVVGFLIIRVFHKRDLGIFLFQHVELLPKIAPYDVDLLDPRPDYGVQHRLDHRLSVDPHQRLRRIQRDGHQSGAEARRHKNRPLHPVGLQRRQTGLCNVDVFRLRDVNELPLQ